MAIASTQQAYEAYKRAAESNDVRALSELYVNDAEFTDVNRRTPPRAPERIRGKDAIRSRLDTVPKNLVHEISNPVLADDRMAFTESCLYPTGEKVFGIHICELRDGKIARELLAEAWDE